MRRLVRDDSVGTGQEACDAQARRSQRRSDASRTSRRTTARKRKQGQNETLGIAGQGALLQVIVGAGSVPGGDRLHDLP